ncbi:MAG: MoaD/ThiS family protein [Tepidanaerobacteraceae bacterium]|jgi:sulfur carrier protein ThiS
MKIKVIFKASLKRYSGNNDGVVFIDFLKGMTVNDILEKFEVNSLDVGLTLVNGAAVPKNTVLKEGDVVELLTMLKGG